MKIYNFRRFLSMENKEVNQEEILETVSEAVEKSQSQKGEVTTLVLMNLKNIYDMASEGMTQQEICERLGINPRTFRKIKANNKAVQAVLENAEQAMTAKVKKSLFQMTQPRIVKSQKVLSNGKIVEYEEVLQPDGSLIKYWLNNKSNGEFSDKQEVNVTKKSFEIIIVDDNGEDVTPPMKTVEADYEVVEEDENK